MKKIGLINKIIIVFALSIMFSLGFLIGRRLIIERAIDGKSIYFQEQLYKLHATKVTE